MKGRIRILFTIPNFKTAGSGREMFNIIERLDKTVFDPIVAVKEAGGSLYDEIIAKGYEVLVKPFTVDVKGGLAMLLSCTKIGKSFRAYKIDVWQSFNWSSDFTEPIIAKIAGAKYVYVKKNMNWERKAWKVKSHLSSAIVARNISMYEGYFSSPFFRSKTQFITGGVNIAQYGSSEVSDIREKLSIPADACMLSCVAQIVRIKDQATLIKAVAKIDGTYLVLAGAMRDEQYANELKELISELGLNNRVFLIGNVSTVNALLHASDIFVLPTSSLNGHEEGCPVALLEAMAAGIPCIASNIAGSKDLIKHEETGLLFQSGNSSELSACIQKYLNVPQEAKRIARTALGYVQAKHTLEIEAEAFNNFYKRLVRSN